MVHRSPQRSQPDAAPRREHVPTREEDEGTPAAVEADGVLALQRAIGNRAVQQLLTRNVGDLRNIPAATLQRYIQVGKDKYNVADLRTKKKDSRMVAINTALAKKKGKPAGADSIFELIKDPDITFVFKDDGALESYISDPRPSYYSMAMKFDAKKACIAQALELAGTGKSAQKWHDEFLALKINYTEDTEVGRSLGHAGFTPVTGITGKVEDVTPQLDDTQTYILVGGSKAELHAVIYVGGEVTDTQGVDTKGIQIDFVYRKR